MNTWDMFDRMVPTGSGEKGWKQLFRAERERRTDTALEKLKAQEILRAEKGNLQFPLTSYKLHGVCTCTAAGLSMRMETLYSNYDTGVIQTVNSMYQM